MRWHVIRALFRKHVYIMLRNLDKLFDVVWGPFTGLLLWGFTAVYLRGLTTDPGLMNMLLGGFILWTFFLIAQQDVNIFILEDFWSHNLNNIFVSPVTLGEYLASTLLIGLGRALTAFTILVTFAFLFYSMNVFAGGIFGVALLGLVLLLFAWAFGMFLTGFIFRFGTSIQFLTWTSAFIMQPFIAVFYPVTSLPVWMQPISSLIPATHAFEGLRAILATGAIPWAHIWIGLGLDIVYLIGSYLVFGFLFREACKQGRVASS